MDPRRNTHGILQSRNVLLMLSKRTNPFQCALHVPAVNNDAVIVGRHFPVICPTAYFRANQKHQPPGSTS